MLKIFTIKFENNIESFNDSILSNFLADKNVIEWEGHFFERKSDHYWTIIVEYVAPSDCPSTHLDKMEKKKDERYREILTDSDWPLFNHLREWRADKSKKQGVPPYIIFTNLQLANIAVTRPESLNALQQLEGIGNAKKEKYGNEIIQLIKTFGLPVKTNHMGEKNG
jgi:ATP-dependent DNA helicase RecQ